LCLTACGPREEAAAGQIYLYGEVHANEKVLERELELWQDYYRQGLRHLLVEFPYYTAQFLNQWMEAEDDAILEDIYADWKGAQAQAQCVKEFFQSIKETCPETVFHGTDVGHQYATTGQRYLNSLREQGLEDSEEWERTQEIIQQGKEYYGTRNNSYREEKMTENLVWEFDALEGESVVGFYGNFHVRTDGGEPSNMALQLREIYGEALHTEDVSYLSELTETRTITIAGKDYEADCFGPQDLTGLVEGCESRTFFRLQDPGEDFADCPTTGDVLPYNNYPVVVEAGKVFVIDYVLTGGAAQRRYYRADGYDWNGYPSTVEIVAG